MWKYFFFIVLFLLLATTPAHAETSLQEFLNAVPHIAGAHYTSYVDDDANVINLLMDEFELRYGATASWDKLFAMYSALAGYGMNSTFGMFFTYLSPDYWNMRLVTRWLEEHPTDFASQAQIIFAPFTLTPEAHDFDGDGVDEWLVHVDGYGISTFWVAKRNSTQTSGYHFYILPIPYHEFGQSRTLYEGQGAALEYLGDANGDGTLEMVFSSFAYAPASWSHASSKVLYLVGWTGEGFEQLADPGIETTAQTYGWAFSNVDDDATDELVVRYFYDDNWLCHRTETHIYDRDGVQYAHRQSSVFAPTLYCDLRQAQEFSYEANYAASIPFYERTLTRFDTLTTLERQTAAPYAAFAQERLVLAYALAGRMDDALTLLDDLRTPSPPEDTIAAALVAVPAAELNAENLCRAAFNAMEAISVPSDRDYTLGINYRGVVVPAFVDETWYGDNTQIAYWSGDDGCDYERILRQHIEATEFPIDQSPADILLSLGVGIVRTLQLDVNGDAVDDWIVVTSLRSPILLFVSQGSVFSQPIQLYGSAPLEGYAVSLPNGAEAWLEPLEPDERGCIMEQGEEVLSTVHPFNLWQYNGTTFSTFTNLAWCSDVLATWTAAETLELWQRVYAGPKEVIYQPVTFVWNADGGFYQQVQVSLPQSDDSGRINELYELVYFRREFTRAVMIADSLLAENETAAVAYYRAVALDMLGRTDEAQASYHRVIELDANYVYADLATLSLDE